jgi:hypothetical protein
LKSQIEIRRADADRERSLKATAARPLRSLSPPTEDPHRTLRSPT